MKKLSFQFITCMITLLLTITSYPSLLYSTKSIIDTTTGTNNGIEVFYVRFDVKSANNRIERSNLLMVPAENEFRQEKFTPFVISGSADYSASDTKGVDIQTRAIHNAIKIFLEKNGLESVKSQSTTVKGLAHEKSANGQTTVKEETVVSFEGAVKLPYKILKSNFNSDTGIYSVTIELKYAPLAFPDKWEKMLFNYKIKMIFNQFKSFF